MLQRSLKHSILRIPLLSKAFFSSWILDRLRGWLNHNLKNLLITMDSRPTHDRVSQSTVGRGRAG